MRKELSKEDQAKLERIEGLIQSEGYTHFYLFAFKVDKKKNELEGEYFRSKDLKPVKAGIAELFREHPKARNFFLGIIAEVVGEERLMFHPLGDAGKA